MTTTIWLARWDNGKTTYLRMISSLYLVGELNYVDYLPAWLLYYIFLIGETWNNAVLSISQRKSGGIQTP